VKIDSVDFFYLSMPEVTTEGDGSEDALLVRVASGRHVGWGECEASPLVSIAAFVCPISHGACRPVSDSVLGQSLDGVSDIARIASEVDYNSMDLLQAPHTWSGIKIALWDLLGHVRGEPVWKLLGYREAFRKVPYASQLFGDTPEETRRRALRARADCFLAVKFGWGPSADPMSGATSIISSRARRLGHGGHSAGRCGPDLQRKRRIGGCPPAGARSSTGSATWSTSRSRRRAGSSLSHRTNSKSPAAQS